MRPQVLRYFTVLAEELHFGRAAARLAITQPPLSIAIKSLEEELGVQLFQRSRTEVQLTPAGAAFRVEARKLLEGMERARSVARAVDQGMTGRIDVGFGPTMLFRDLLQVTDQFNREHPAIEVVLHEMPTADQYDRLMRGQLDAGFTHGATTPPKLQSVPLKEDVFVLAVPEGHPLADRSVVSLKDLGDESFIMFTREINPVNHDNVIGMFSRVGIHPRFTHFTRAWMTSMSMVSEGRGVAIVPGTLARMRMAGVRLVPLSGPRIPAHALLAWNPAMVSHALEKFIDSATGSIARLKAAPSRRKQRA